MAGEESLVQERELKMVSFSGNGEPITRTGYFLKPTASFTDEAIGDSPAPSLPKPTTSSTEVSFKGWRYPHRKWSQWVDKLEPHHKNLWKKTGIYDALKASACVIRQCPDLILALAEYWCPDTNTFFFPWSEATITLEDVAILGGFSLTGEPAKMMGPPTGEMLKSQTKMVSEHQSFNRRPAKKAAYSDWLNHYMEEGCESDELEHVAFLSFWLSKHVFPAPPFGSVGQHVFLMAIRLAQGTRIAMGPSILCSIYQDLKILKKHSIDFADGGGYPLFLWAQFQILQLWAWERFMFLRPEEGPHLVNPDEPRAAVWDNLSTNLDLSFMRLVFNSPDEFQWRPYSVNLGNSTPWPSNFYKDMGGWVCCNSSEDEEMESFVRCLRPCELLGLDSIEQYLPHRVAMQFGLDQDIPGNVVRANSTWEVAWRTYDKPAEKVVFYVPPRLFESDVTLRYYNWRKDYMSSGVASVHDALGDQDPLKYVPKKSLPKKKIAPSKAEKMILQDDDHVPLSKVFGLDTFDFTTEEKKGKAHNPSSSNPNFQEQLTSITEEKECGRPRVSSECPSSSPSVQQPLPSLRKRIKCEMPELSSNVSQTKETTRELRVGETSTCVIIDDDEVEEVYTKRMKVGKSAYNPIVIEDPKGKLPVKNNLTEGDEGLKEAALIRDMNKFEEEIDRIGASIMRLESDMVKHRQKHFPSISQEGYL